MIKLDSKNWLINWFEKNSTIAIKDIKKHLDENYLEKGWIDSFKFITFITDIENNFKIRFSNNEFQNRKFATINGLSKIINVKKNAKF